MVNCKPKFIRLTSLLLLLWMGNSLLVSAQTQINISGTVIDENGTLLSDVNVGVTGGSTLTKSTETGTFTLVVPANSSLVFSRVGYARQTYQTGDASVNALTITLQSEQETLDEVVVVGYGTRDRSLFAGAAVSLDAEDLNRSSISVANMLQGRAAGVQVSQNNGTPGASLSIRIRGTNSINADSEPLYVIDGFPSSEGIGMTIKPEDIESITILKDAASTSIYGARGANGVVLITTKKGTDKRSSLNINSSVGYQRIIDRYNLLGSYDYALRRNRISEQNGVIPPYSEGRLDSLQAGILGTDWQNEVFQVGHVNDHSLNFIGGTDRTGVYTSFDYLNQEGVVTHSKYSRIGARINVDHRVSDQFTLSGRVFGNYGIQNDLPLAPSTINGFLKQVLHANPASTFDSGVSARLDAQNPLHFIEAEDRENTSYRTNGYFSMKYEPIHNLFLQADFGADINKTEQFYFAPSTVPNASATNGRGSIISFDSKELIFNPTARYNRTFAKHNIGLLAGYNYQTYLYFEYGTTATNFSSDNLGYNNLGTAQNFSSYSARNRTNRASWFGRVDYDYDTRYSLTATYRIDGSSVFGRSNKLGYFPSVAAAWNVKHESFATDLTWLSQAKLRASYGLTGNDRISPGISLATYASNNSTRYTEDGLTSVNGIAVVRLSNPDLKWESTKALDLGVELGFVNDRIVLVADYYDKYTDNLLLDRNISPSTGFIFRTGNAGAVSNKGWEFSLQTVNVRNEHIEWSTSFNYSNNRNRVRELGSNDADIYVGSVKPDGAANFEDPFIIRVGEPIGSINGYLYDGILLPDDPALTTTHPNAEVGDPKYVDVNGDGILNTEDRVILGTGVPTSFFGMTNSLRYKGFDLTVVLQGQAGGKLVNVQNLDMMNPLTTGNVLAETETDTWTPDNPGGTLPQRGFYGTSHGGWVNSRFVESSDFLRLKNVTLAYQIPSKLLSKIRVSQLQVYANAQNLHTWTSYTGLDPEIGNLATNDQQNRNVGRGLDFNAYPLAKMYIFGLRLTF
ncbi:SusC/RagA family TonB-linked outer membrane protein [Parapedobacter koreensis]|uniref:TonB-linked outer membrane protein, SusC/RagA family n=1 Tax=Parapedobacter koreensis TaxID=332977 RepID=A0A1H7S579_9SPHI|nr:TonB-dependent receptor [Parapedobacter koreensis]SEL67665.1 TonB-linked outer membrane protein, SusC/RagA family [Parapedobacter koreensis]